MYEKHFGFKEKPFENTPDPKYLYYSPSHEEGLNRMLYVVKEGKGAGLLTGVYGCGKTLLARALMKELSDSIYKVAIISNPRLDDVEMLRMISYSLGASNPPTRKADVLITLGDILKNNISDGKKTVILIDEAHAIEDKSIFEELRLLLNFQEETRFLLSLLIFGQPELKEKVESNKQLNQRIAMRFFLEPLSQEEVAKYIEHRLKIAGAPTDNSIFTDDAIALIAERSGGIPRRINLLCDSALLVAYGKGIKTIDTDIIVETVHSLQI